MSVPSPIAYVGADRQIHLVRTDGSGRRALTLGLGVGGDWGGSADRSGCSWPGFSPDGRWISFFQGPLRGEEEGEATLYALEVDGVEVRQVASVGPRAPIYARWSPDGRRLAALLQQGSGLELWSCDVDLLGEPSVIEKGVPLFASWSKDSTRLVIHAGDPRGSRDGVRLVSLEEGVAPEELTRRPGSFCTPFEVAGSWVYARRTSAGSVVMAAPVEGGRPRELMTLEGLLAMVPAPDGSPRIAVGSAPSGEGSPYDGVWILSLETGLGTRVVHDPCMAFFWAPGARRLATVAWDPRAGLMRLGLTELQGPRSAELCSFFPTREQFFHLHFFEQYADSHPLFSPDGGTIVFAGHRRRPQPGEAHDPPGILLLDLAIPHAAPVRLADGHVATFPPPPAAPEPECP